MTRTTATTLRYEIDAPRSVVYRFRLDCENLPKVNPAISNVRRTDQGAGMPAAGTQYVCDCKVEFGEFTAEVNIEEAVEPSLIVLDMYSDMGGTRLRGRETARFSDRENDGTEVEVEITFYAPDDWPEDAFQGLVDHGADPIHVELSATKQLLEAHTMPP